jgi:ketosteroid isomerase-like protein
MTNWLLHSCATLALALPCWALGEQAVTAGRAAERAPPNNAAAHSAVADLLEAKVRAAWTAFKNKDADAYGRFLADDFQAVESDGEGERTRAHVLGEVRHCMYTDYLLQFFQVQPLGPDYAFVTYESSMQFPKGSALRFRRVFVSELWTRSHEQWRMLRYQETLVR